MRITSGILGTSSINNIWAFIVYRTNTLKDTYIFAEDAATKQYYQRIFNGNSLRYRLNNGNIDYNLSGISGVYNLWTSGTSTGTTGPSGYNKSIYIDGLLVATDNSSQGDVGGENTMFIGAPDGDSNTASKRFDGEISEIIITSSIPTALDQQCIETYLAIKYGITLNPTNNNATIIEGDYIAADGVTKIWDYTANSTFHNDVAVIGRDNTKGVLNQKQSKSINSDALITIGLGGIATSNQSNSNVFLANNNFLAWGNNGTVALAITTATLLCSPEKTLNRTWKIIETGSVGSVKIAATGTTLDGLLNTPNTLKLSKVADDVEFTTNVEYIPVASETINGTAEYTATYNFNGTKYFTYTELNAIVWSGNTISWRGGAGTAGAPHASADVAKLLIIDAQSAGNNAFINSLASVGCAWIKSGSKLVVNNNTALIIQDQLVLDGELRMIGNAQLVQKHTGLTQVSGLSKIYIDQLGTTTTTYRYNYWSSPVVDVGQSTMTLASVMKDGTIPTSETSTPLDMLFTAQNDGIRGIPITIADRWVVTFTNGTTGADWVFRGKALNIHPHKPIQ